MKLHYSDIHTHIPAPGALVSIEPGEQRLPGVDYSVGIHPWHVIDKWPTLRALKRLVAEARLPSTKAIGEAGLDKNRGDFELQRPLFRFHAKLAHRLGLPLIIHCVRAYDLILQEASAQKPSPGQWIIHGFRGNPTLARQLTEKGIALSFGKKYNQASYEATPENLRYRETDSL